MPNSIYALSAAPAAAGVWLGARRYLRNVWRNRSRVIGAVDVLAGGGEDGDRPGPVAPEDLTLESVYRHVKWLDGRMTVLENAVSDRDAQIARLEEQLASLRAENERLHGENVGLREQIAALESQLAALRRDGTAA